MKMTIETLPGPRNNPRYGYHNSLCRITFDNTNGALVKEYQKSMVELFWEFKKPHNMWCYTPKHVESSIERDVWEFEFGYDSGD
jgi:hypothetical protein